MKLKSLFLFAASSLFFCASAQPGAFDSDFSSDGKLTLSFFSSTPDTAYALAIQPDGKILVAGSTNNGSESVSAIARLNPDGSLDGGFGAGGKRVIDFPATAEYTSIRAMALQGDGKIVTAGYYTSTLAKTFFVARFKSNGDFDSTFSSDGLVLTSFGTIQDKAFCLALQPNGNIVVGGTTGNSNDNDFAIVRYLPNGTLDSTFSFDGKVTTQLYTAIGGFTTDDYINSIHIQPDGKILAVGFARPNFFGSNTSFALARYNDNGTLDTGFDADGKLLFDLDSTDSEAYCSSILPDGKILIAGCANDSFVISKLTATGNIDSLFGENGIAEHSFASSYSKQQFNALALQPDGKIIAVGFRYNAGLSGYMVWRLKSNGEADSTFGTNGYVFHGFGIGTQNGMANAVALQADGRILVAGFGSSNPDEELVISRYYSGLNLGVMNFSKKQKTITVYPNPVSDIVNLKYTLTQSEVIGVQLFDMQGRLVATLLRNELQQAGDIEKQFSFSAEVGSGNYLLSVVSNKGVKSVQIVKQ